MEADFIQLRGPVYAEFAVYTDLFRKNDVRINYFGTDDPDLTQTLFELGIDFPFVDDIYGVTRPV